MVFVRDKKTGKIMDPERNAILQSRGGRSDGYKHWEIDWNGEVLGFTARDHRQYGGETKNIPMGIEWFVASMKIPEGLKEKRSEIMGMIKESLDAEWKNSGFQGCAVIKFDSRLIR